VHYPRERGSFRRRALPGRGWSHGVHTLRSHDYVWASREPGRHLGGELIARSSCAIPGTERARRRPRCCQAPGSPRASPGTIVEAMGVGIPSKTTAAKAGAKGATKVVRSRTARRVAKGGAKATWFVGKKVAKRKARKHARRYRDSARTAWSAVRIYGPIAAEALGLVERPKPRRRSPAFVAGIAVGAGAMHLAGRHRAA
jgi:hypothetical protein